MIILKQVIHFVDTNSVEVTWVESDDPGVAVRCHSYADVQMGAMRADLGDDVGRYEDLIALVEANIKPVVPEPPPILIATKYKFRMALLNIGLLDDIESFIAATEDKAVKIAWQYADEYRTDDPLVLGMGYALGKTDDEIRAVFELANTL